MTARYPAARAHVRDGVDEESPDAAALRLGAHAHLLEMAAPVDDVGDGVALHDAVGIDRDPAATGRRVRIELGDGERIVRRDLREAHGGEPRAGLDLDVLEHRAVRRGRGADHGQAVDGRYAGRVASNVEIASALCSVIPMSSRPSTRRCCE